MRRQRTAAGAPCACAEGFLAIVFDHGSPAGLRAALACVGLAGLPSCGRRGEWMTQAEAEALVDVVCAARRRHREQIEEAAREAARRHPELLQSV